MVKEELKKDLKEILEVVKLCPPELQNKCFEVLLQDALARRGHHEQREEFRGEQAGTAHMDEPQAPGEIRRRMDLFAKQYNLSWQEISRVYSLDQLGNVSIEAADLKATKSSKRQRRLALLCGGRHQFMEGSFDVPLEELRELCVTYATYDAGNFITNLKNSKEIFAGFKADGANKLSPKGKTELGALIKELASQSSA